MEQKKLSIAVVVLFVLGLILIAIGVALIPILDKKIKETVQENVKLVNNSEAYKSWKDPPVPIYISYYFFNVTNPEAVVNDGSKAHVEEFGPFTYREYRNKTDIVFSKNGDRIRYKEHKYYVFNQSLSAFEENFTICTLNIPILTLATELRFMNAFVQDVVAIALEEFNETLFECHTVKELLWGYTPKIVQEINDELKKHKIPYRFNYTFGIYSGPTANGTDDGEVEIYSGVGNISDLGLVSEWRGNSSLPFWTGPCNSINGSDGTLWHPFVSKDETLYVFNTDLCRSLYVTYSGSSVISSSNIATYHLTPPPSVMADPRTCVANRCFCQPYDSNGTFCLGAGVLNVSLCRSNSPIIMSQPHFFEAPEYVNGVVGMKPNAKEHQTVLEVEPTTGLVLSAAKKIQVNMFVEELRALRDTSKLNGSIVFPITWVNEHATITDDEAAKLYKELFVPMKEADALRYGLIAIGGFLVLLGLILLVVVCVKRKREETTSDEERRPLLTNESS